MIVKNINLTCKEKLFVYMFIWNVIRIIVLNIFKEV